MKMYSVPVNFTYTEYIDVEADSPKEAWDYVMKLDKCDILDDKRAILVDELEWDWNWLDSMVDDVRVEEVVEEIEK